jgi:hypothetical protein
MVPVFDIFGYIGLGFLGLALLAAIVYGITKAGLLPALQGFGKSSYDYFVTWFSLVPYVVFLSGPIVDIVSSRFMYTKASLAGFITLLIVAFFGSEWFAGISSSLLGFLPSIRDAATGATRWGWLGAYALLIGGLGVSIFMPFFEGKTTIGLGTSAATIVILSTILAGNNLLGDTAEVVRTVSGDSSTSYAGITIADVCATPGLGCIQTSFAPTGILLNTSILACHFFESMDTKNTSGMIASGGAMGLTWLVEMMTLGSKGCISAYKYGWGSPIISTLLGVGSGAAAYYTMRTIGQESFTSSDQDGGVFHPPPPPATKSASEKLSTKIVVGPQPDTSEPVDDQDAFVCEAYKDGELITSTIVD